MARPETKILKLLLSFGLFIYLIYYDISHETFAFTTIISAFAVAGIVYLIITFFGFSLSISGNYLIAIIITVVVLFFIAGKLDELIAAIDWLNEDRVLTTLGVLGAIFMSHDIKTLLHFTSPSQAQRKASMSGKQMEDDKYATTAPIKTAQQAYKENPEWMMDLSKELEQRRGHKPTYEELIDYVDNELFHLKTDEEIRRETEALMENIKRKVTAEMNKEKSSKPSDFTHRHSR